MAKRKREAGAPNAEPKTAGTPGEEREEVVDDGPEQVTEDLDSLLADTRRERDEYLELAQRARADFENYRKRVARETKEAERRGTAKLAGELIPAVDNLERALQAAGIDISGPGKGSEDGSPEPGDALAEGVLLVYRDLQEMLARAGVQAVDPKGEKFDPEWHEALSTRSEGDTEPGVVLEVIDKGYKLDGQVLRAARVVVSE
jgi:molecular chaperone GrpE